MTSTLRTNTPSPQAGQFNENDLPNKQVDEQTQQQKDEDARKAAQPAQNQEASLQPRSSK